MSASRSPRPSRHRAVDVRIPERPRIRPLRLLIAWILSAVGLLFAAWLVPGIAIEGWSGAFVAAALIADPERAPAPLLAALRLPLTLVLGFLLVLVLDAAMFILASDIAPDAISVDSWGAARSRPSWPRPLR